jgi:SAM-dependent methyltransferase
VIGIVKKILDMGCGNQKKDGAITIDINPVTKPDIIHDLNKFPYPFETSTFDEIYIDNVLEHLDNIMKVMEEIHRISKPDGTIIIKVPYFRSRYAYNDPTHYHFFTIDGFTYFDPTHIHHALYPYSPCLFATIKMTFDENFPTAGFTGFFKKIFLHFANKYPAFYEHYLSHLLPLDELTFYLKTIKTK